MRTKRRKPPPWACFLHSGPRVSVQDSIHARGCQRPGLDHLRQEHANAGLAITAPITNMKGLWGKAAFKIRYQESLKCLKNVKPLQKREEVQAPCSRPQPQPSAPRSLLTSMRTSSRDPENCIVQLQLTGSHFSSL